MAKKLPDKDDIEHFKWLADRASARFDGRRSYEWQVNFALWGALGAAIVALVRDDVPADLHSFVGWAAVALFGVYLVLWIPWIQEANSRDQHTAY